MARTANHRCAPTDRPNLYQPHLELLESRLLPLGDALLGAVLGASLAAPGLAVADSCWRDAGNECRDAAGKI
jgi:hypothetical protein